jgi:DNA-binding XRE family transcriptional regulator
VSALDALLEELGVDPTNPSVALAVRNYRNDRDYLHELRKLRELHRLSVDTVATRMGVSPATVRELEGWDSDPTLQRLRWYANAIGARTAHEVTDNVVEEPTC